MGRIRPEKAREAFIDLIKVDPEDLYDKNKYQEFVDVVIEPHEYLFRQQLPQKNRNYGKISANIKEVCRVADKYLPLKKLPKLCQQIVLRNNGGKRKKKRFN